MTANAIAAIHARLDKLDAGLLTNAQLILKAATLSREHELLWARWATKLDELVESLAFSKKVICLLTARVEKVEQELKEIGT